MGKRIKKLKNVRVHREGVNLLITGAFVFITLALLLWYIVDDKVLFWGFVVIFGSCYAITLNFFQCPIRKYEGDSDGVVVAPADGRIVVVEEILEDTYFHEPRIMVSIFMSLFNVHANWVPCDGKVIMSKHFNGNFHKAWLPKASEENEHADTIIETEKGQQILYRQIAGAVARRIVTYVKDGDECTLNEHLGFIKFGSRVDLFLPIDTKVKVKIGTKTKGNYTIIANL